MMPPLIWDAWGGGVLRLCIRGTNLFSNTNDTTALGKHGFIRHLEIPEWLGRGFENVSL